MRKKEISLALNQLENALARLNEALQTPLDPNNITRDATLKRFQFTAELYWKTLKKLLLNEKIISTTPRDTLQKAYSFNWINNETLWLNMMDDRNLTSHAYREEYAKKIHTHIKEYYPEMKKNAGFLVRKI